MFVLRHESCDLECTAAKHTSRTQLRASRRIAGSKNTTRKGIPPR
jgi:hypothetical protein